MKVLIVDDEQLARDRLARMVNGFDAYEVVGEAGNGIDAVQQVDRLRPEAVLLDIRMPGTDGLEAARHFVEFDEPPAVIFCTAYEEHAVEAFGYLLKPVRKDDLEVALGNAQRVNKAQLAALADNGNQCCSHVSTRTRRGIELIPVDEARYFQADQKYVTVRHADGEIIIDDTLRDLEDEFGDQFVRVHRNALVGVRHVVGLDRSSDGHHQIRLKDVEENLDISRRHVAGVRKVVKKL
ncbi:MAG: LytTR family DNA-binding domain-containing protein [Pseudomonadales bacterium]